MVPRKLAALMLLALLLTPGASAAVVKVPDSNQGFADFGSTTGTSFSLSLNPNYFNLTSGDAPNGINWTELILTYDVSEAKANFASKALYAGGPLGAGLGSIFGVPPPESREYRTSVYWNASAWLNLTTTFVLGGGRATSAFVWQVCNTVQYTFNGTTYGAQPVCDTNFVGGSPNQVIHAAKFGHLTIGGFPRVGFIAAFHTDESADNSFTSASMGVNLTVPPTTAPNWTSSVSASTRDLAGDVSKQQLVFIVTTNANSADIELGLRQSSCDGFGCLIMSAIGVVFGVLNFVLSHIFTFVLVKSGSSSTDVGSTFSSGVTTAASVLIGIPSMLFLLMITHPGKSFLAWTDYLLLLGIVRYGSNRNAEINVVWETPLNFWRWVFRGIMAFFRWFWELVERAFQAILNASPITLLIIAGLVTLTAILGVIRFFL